MGDCSGEGVSGRKVEVKAIVGWGAVAGSVSSHHRVCTKKITSRRYAGQPTQEVCSSLLRIAGPMVEE